MSHLSKVINSIPVPVQNRSGFDLSHEHLFTAKVGTLVPAACIEVLPNDKFRMGCLANVQLPPMATNFYGRVDARIEAFFCPNRLLYQGWQSFITGINDSNDEGSIPVADSIPYISLNDVWDVFGSNPYLVPGSLCDYLGFKDDREDSSNGGFVNALPFLAYHRIWNDWYRDSRIQKPAFVDKSVDDFNLGQGFDFRAANLPYYSIPPSVDPGMFPNNVNDDNLSLYDGVSILSLRQRNYAKDYFTAATLKPQSGDESSLSFTVDEEGKGSFSIASLRAANSLQKFLERNNIAGSRYIDQIKVHFGCRPADATLQRPLYLGGTTIGVYNKSVMQSAGDSTSTQNPFSSIATKYGSSQAIGDDMLFDDFHATEHGFIMVMFSLVPHANYSTGEDRMLLRRYIGDYAFPVLAGIGDQPIYQSELTTNSSETDVFGYCQRYSEYKYLKDRVSGLLNSSLSAFALKRGFKGTPTLNSSFLEIPTTALDEVAAVSSSISTYGCWVDMYFNLKAVRPLPVYSLPTLGDEKDVHTELMNNGGFRL